MKSVKLPPRSPNLNAYAQRFVRSIKESCLKCLILFGEGPLRKAVHEFLAHDHGERNHQGLRNRLITPDPGLAASRGRPHPAAGGLGGTLNYDYRGAA
jgi:hypothetical protein